MSVEKFCPPIGKHGNGFAVGGPFYRSFMLKEIIEKLSKLEVFEKRAATDEYHEVVFFTKDLPELENILGGILGECLKPPKARLTKEDACLVDGYGGVRAGQALFRKKFDGFTVMAILWPWQDREHVTLKLALVTSGKNSCAESTN